MTPEQCIKHMIIALTDRWDGKETDPLMSADDIESRYSELEESDAHWDAMSEVRCSGIETGLDCDYSRHYESDAVAAKAPNGQWVGWTYWYGGGKHGDPGSIDWMEYAYFVDCVEEEKVQVVRTFTKQEEA